MRKPGAMNKKEENQEVESKIIKEEDQTLEISGKQTNSQVKNPQAKEIKIYESELLNERRREEIKLVKLRYEKVGDREMIELQKELKNELDENDR